jgi:hypothetical protein
LVPLQPHTNALKLFRQHPFNLRHIVVKNGLQAVIIPLYCYARPIRFSDSANITCRGSPANTVAYFEKSGLVAGHLRFILGGSTSSTRSIALWPVKLRWPSPLYGDVCGLNRSDLAAICRVTIEANATANF